LIVLESDNIKLPRVNKKYNKNFSLTKEYRAGKRLLYTLIMLNCLPTVEGPYAIIINVGTHLDIDAFCKPLLDSMQDANLIDNDKNVLALCINKTKVKRNQPNYIKVELFNIEEVKNE